MSKTLAIALWVAFVVALSAAGYVGFNPPQGGEPISLTDFMWAISVIGFPTAGALIATKLPRRPLGWILLVSPLCIMTAVFLGDGPVDFLEPARARYYAVISDALFSAGLIALMMVPLFIPDGRLRSARWKPIAVAAVIGGVVVVATTLLAPGRLAETSRFVNPLGIEGFAPVAGFIRKIEWLVYLSTLFSGITSVVLRFRAARGRERQQLKWLVLGLATVATSIITSAILIGFKVSAPEALVTGFFAVAFLSLPIAIGIAVLRDRLYDVDLIINRALVYGALTAILIGLYLLVILAFRSLLPISDSSDIGVAASTLIVAGLFQPARTRIQRFIDKRFYRRKYDAVSTLAAFTARLRDEVELERIRKEAVGVVAEAVQPAHASIWLRGTA